MRLEIKVLKVVSVNIYKSANFVEINQGETADFYFQLVDKDQSGLRYVPDAGATVFVEIPRYPDYLGTATNSRQTVDYSVRRNAIQAFPGQDPSIWRLPLTAADTLNMMSSDVRITVTEGAKISKCLFSQGIKVIPREGSPQ